jgi:para-nitrobenzyl esterase
MFSKGPSIEYRRPQVWFLLPLLLIALTAAVSSAEPVKVEEGLLQGTVEDSLAVYRGIPYAAPPVGDLRWRAPQPPPKWQGVRTADKFGHTCPQADKRIEDLTGPSEDCLYLNVWTPASKASDKLAVFVWIHGGGFYAGATAEPLYHGEALAKKGVVVVTIDYRLGVLGFLAYPGLSAENSKHVSGNYGMLDMIAALGWVHRNIAAFGGNPKRVTIAGESAGGIAVSMLCASPLARGLFQGAISESGGSFGPVRSGGGPGENVQPLADAEKDGAAWAEKIGASSVADLRSIPADKLLEESRSVRGVAWPIMDGWVIPDDEYKLYAAGKYNDTPVLIGYNSDEGASFGPPSTVDAYKQSVQRRYGQFANQLLALYPAGNEGVGKPPRDLSRDTLFGWHTWTWARLQTKTGKSRAYLYYFNQHPDYLADSPRFGYGSTHGSEIPYVFEHLGLPGRPQPTAEDHSVSDLMSTYWINFTKTGNPNGPGLPKWPAYKDEQPQTMQFGEGVAKTGAVENKDGLMGLDSYFAWRRASEDSHDAGDMSQSNGKGGTH